MFTLKQKLWFTDTANNKKSSKEWRGRVCFINKFYMTLSIKYSKSKGSFKESFLLSDINIGRYVFNE